MTILQFYTKVLKLNIKVCYNDNGHFFSEVFFREVLIKSGMQIMQTDFSSGGCRPRIV